MGHRHRGLGGGLLWVLHQGHGAQGGHHATLFCCRQRHRRVLYRAEGLWGVRWCWHVGLQVLSVVLDGHPLWRGAQSWVRLQPGDVKGVRHRHFEEKHFVGNHCGTFQRCCAGLRSSEGYYHLTGGVRGVRLCLRFVQSRCRLLHRGDGWGVGHKHRGGWWVYYRRHVRRGDQDAPS